MTLESIYYIGQSIAVIAILATLAAVLYQAKQANEIATAELSMEAWMDGNELHSSYYKGDEAASFVNKAVFKSEPLNEVEMVRLNGMMLAIFTAIEAMESLNDHGLFEKALLGRNWITIRQYLNPPNVRYWWRHFGKHYFHGNFRTRINEMVAEIEEKEAAHAEKVKARAKAKADASA